MNSKKLRKLDEVNGWKVNHPHSAANIFYILFTFFLIASPLAYLFFPNVYIASKDHPFAPSGDFKGSDLFIDVYNILKSLVSGADITCSNPFTVAFCGEGFTGKVLHEAIPYFLIVYAALIILMLACSLVLLILFIVHLVKGYLKHSGVIKAFVVVEFVLSLLYSISLLVPFIGSLYSNIQKADMVLNIWNPFFIMGGIMFFFIVIVVIYSVNFRDSIPETEIEIHDGPTVEHIQKVHEVTKVTFSGASTLPTEIESIGGHAYAENQALVVANIPTNITKLGNSAFANCLNLKVVSLPRGLTSIGFNCFFNCASLERVNYAGTKEEWKKIARGSNWLLKAKTTQVVCLDGAIIVNPHH